MIEPVRVPGTRSDPEFAAVRVPPWEAPFSCRVLFPEGLPGLNESLTDQWWSDRSGELRALGARMASTDAGTLVTTQGFTESDPPESTIVVCPPFPQLLDLDWAASEEADFDAWVTQRVLSSADTPTGVDSAVPTGVGGAPWRYDQTVAHGLGSTKDSQLFCWPGDPSELTLTELLGAPHLPELAELPDFASLAPQVVPVARELWSQADAAAVTYRLTLVHRALDAVAILQRGTDARETSRVSPRTGSALRTLSKDIRTRALASGWRLTGYADALLWPIALDDPGELPMDFVCDVALDLMRRSVAVALPPAPDLAEWDRRLIELESLQARGGG